MGLVADLIHSVQVAPPLYATRVVVGPRFTAVAGAPDCGADATATAGGVAYTGAADTTDTYDAVVATRQVEQGVLRRPLAALAYGLLEGTIHGHPAESCPRPGPCAPPVTLRADVGAAALNALLQARLRAVGTNLADENGLDILAQHGAGKRLAVVGRFPGLASIRAGATQSWVLELRPQGDDLPAGAAPEVLPQADVVGITGSTLANGTLEGLLALCRPDAFVILIGPTTPLSPLLFEHGVDVLCGTLVEQPARVLDLLAGEQTIPTPRLPGMRAVSLRAGA